MSGPNLPRQTVNLRKGIHLRVFPQYRKHETRLTTIHGSQLLMDGAPMPLQSPG